MIDARLLELLAFLSAAGALYSVAPFVGGFGGRAWIDVPIGVLCSLVSVGLYTASGKFPVTSTGRWIAAGVVALFLVFVSLKSTATKSAASSHSP